MRELCYILMMMIMLSCGGAQTSNDFNPTRTKEEVKRMLDAYHEDIKKGGLTAEFKYLDNSADFFWVPPGYHSALTYDSVKTILETNAPTFSFIEFKWDTLQVFPLTSEIANYTGIVNSLMVDTAGVETNMSIIESGTLIKRESGWKLLSGQSRLRL